MSEEENEFLIAFASALRARNDAQREARIDELRAMLTRSPDAAEELMAMQIDEEKLEALRTIKSLNSGQQSDLMKLGVPALFHTMSDKFERDDKQQGADKTRYAKNVAAVMEFITREIPDIGGMNSGRFITLVGSDGRNSIKLAMNSAETEVALALAPYVERPNRNRNAYGEFAATELDMAIREYSRAALSAYYKPEQDEGKYDLSMALAEKGGRVNADISKGEGGRDAFGSKHTLDAILEATIGPKYVSTMLQVTGAEKASNALLTGIFIEDYNAEVASRFSDKEGAARVIETLKSGKPEAALEMPAFFEMSREVHQFEMKRQAERPRGGAFGFSGLAGGG